MTLQWIKKDNSALEWLGQRPRALGQPTFEQCFREVPDFTPCWQTVFRQSQIECQSIMQQPNPYGNYDNCVNTLARQYANQNCIPACESYLRGGALYPWGVRSNDTCEVQRDINVALVEQGYNPIAVDCVMGPRTCGASDAVGFGVPASCVPHRGEWIAPTRAGQGPAPTPRPPPTVAKKRNIGALLLAASALVAGGFALVGRG